MFSRNVLDKPSGNELYISPDVTALNPETFSLSFFFGVLDNNLNPTWADILVFFKDVLSSGFYREVSPHYITLESINIKVMAPTGEESLSKVYTTLEKGALGNMDNIEESMVYAFNLYSSVLVSSRNQFQIRLPNVGLNGERDALEEGIAERLQSTIKLLSSNIIFTTPNSEGQVVFRLLINTQEQNAVSPYFPVDSLQALGFTAPRIIRSKKK